MIGESPWRSLQFVRRAFQSIFEQGSSSPETWRQLSIQPVPKRRDATRLSNTRGICLISVMSK
eukprot:7403133-Pyramimonas_sp.AAC.1